MNDLTNKETQELLRETLRLTKENNAILRIMRRNAAIGFWFRIVLYLVIVGLPILVYRYYVSEYVEDIRATYEELKRDAQNLGVPLPAAVGRVFEEVGQGPVE